MCTVMHFHAYTQQDGNIGGRQASRLSRTLITTPAANVEKEAVSGFEWRTHLALSSAKLKSIGGAQTESNSRNEGAWSAQRLRTVATYSAIFPVVAGAKWMSTVGTLLSLSYAPYTSRTINFDPLCECEWIRARD